MLGYFANNMPQLRVQPVQQYNQNNLMFYGQPFLKRFSTCIQVLLLYERCNLVWTICKYLLVITVSMNVSYSYDVVKCLVCEQLNYHSVYRANLLNVCTVK
jgi:hypothetical protein